MSGCPSQQQLDLYLDDQLDAPRRAWLEGHVGACRACQQALEAAVTKDSVPLRGMRAGQVAAADEPSHDLLIRIERAGMPSPRDGSHSDVVIGVTGAYVLPPDVIPEVSGNVASPNEPTRAGAPL